MCQKSNSTVILLTTHKQSIPPNCQLMSTVEHYTPNITTIVISVRAPQTLDKARTSFLEWGGDKVIRHSLKILASPSCALHIAASTLPNLHMASKGRKYRRSKNHWGLDSISAAMGHHHLWWWGTFWWCSFEVLQGL